MAPVKERRLRGVTLGALRLFGACLLVLLVLEGAASVWRFAGTIWSVREPLAERSHTRYDELLGWSHVPSLHLEDLYGPGRDLTTNSQGYRATRDYAAEVPPGLARVVCCGDSFTLGYGVGDEETWCWLVGELDPGLETVNMGQGGYGIDQAFLWYRRDAPRLAHDALVFSFITPGFRRMRMTKFIGYPKPRLRLRDGVLETENVPVPEGGLRHPRLAQWAMAFDELATYRAARRLLVDEAGPPRIDDREARELALAVFDELARMTAAAGRALVLVWLPMAEDWASPESDLLRYFVAAECEKRGLCFVDLVEEIRRLPRDEARALFDGHFSVAGNRFAAERLLERVGPRLRGEEKAPR